MPDTKHYRWLHLSDLHLGCRGDAMWKQVKVEFAQSIKDRVEHLGPPDLLLLTCDLSFSGTDKQFQQMDQFLDELMDWLGCPSDAPSPLIFPVPGNHDLARPQGMAALPYAVLDHYSDGLDSPHAATLDKTLWHSDKDSKPDASFLHPCSQNIKAGLIGASLHNSNAPE